MLSAGTMMLGLGLAGDAFGALSNYEQARRQKEQYRYAQQFRDPNWVLAQSQPYINRLNATLAEQTPALMRTQVNPMLGSRGIDPSSGAGQSIYANALAPFIVQNQQEGMNQFMRASGQGQQYGGQNVGQTYGNGQNLQQMLRLMYMRNAGQPTGTATASATRQPYTGTGYEGLEQFAQVPMSSGYGANPWERQFVPGMGRNDFDTLG